MQQQQQGFDVRFQIPSNMLIVGPTSSGKTTWLKNLIRHKEDYFSSPPQTMLLFYKEHQKAYGDMEKWMREGAADDDDLSRREEIFPVFKKFKNPPRSKEDWKDIFAAYPRNIPKIVVFDDYLDEVGPALTYLFTVLTHHHRCFTIFLSQTLFDRKNDLRTLSINTQYMVLFNNPRDRMSVSQLAKQVFPGKVGLLNQAYRKVTSGRGYGYLLLDFHQRQDDRLRIRSHIFPLEYPMQTHLLWDSL